jgi:hypothetical protein
MGSSLLRNTRKITESGSTLFEGYETPTLTLLGVKDGLLRISRGAEAFWHQEENIDESQKGMFPVIAIDKASHSSFLDRTMPLPSHVKSNDLNPEIDQVDGYEKISNSMVAFMSGIIGDTTLEETTKALRAETKSLLQPLMDGMFLEGSYAIKEACYDSELINPPSNTCEHGSEWSKTAQKIMGGDISQL